MGDNRRFYVASEEEILEGRITDVYFMRTREILEKSGESHHKVYAEVHNLSLIHISEPTRPY